jgi:glycosyltransferase involved in cell wall biosynthesis
MSAGSIGGSTDHGAREVGRAGTDGEPPEVTVVIPTRNRASLLQKTALRAALSQEGVNVEVIVVDDASTDETPLALERVDDLRLRVLRHDVRRGQFRARNAGIAHARGEWIAFLDDDDVWSPAKLRSQLDVARAAGASFVYTGAVMIGSRVEVKGVVDAPPAEDLASRLLVRNWMRAGSSTVAARADLVATVGGFDEQLSELADWDFWIRLALEGRPAACPDLLAGYLSHPGNRRVVDESDVEPEFRYLSEKHREAQARLGVRLDGVTFSRWVAEGHRRAGRRLKASRVYLETGVAERNVGNLFRALVTPIGPAVDAVYDRLSARGGLPEPSWLAIYRDAAPLV